LSVEDVDVFDCPDAAAVEPVDAFAVEPVAAFAISEAPKSVQQDPASEPRVPYRDRRSSTPVVAPLSA
jgi:hypothetical protein